MYFNKFIGFNEFVTAIANTHSLQNINSNTNKKARLLAELINREFNN